MSRGLLGYVIAPLALTLPLVLAYASGDPGPMAIVASKRLGREFGLLEGAQALLLLASVGVLALGAVRARDRGPRVLLAALAAGFAFLLLEEIDYGVQYLWWLAGDHAAPPPGDWSVHHGLRATDLLKWALDTLVALVFVLGPLTFGRTKSPLLRFLRPNPWSIASVAAMVGLSKLAHRLADGLPPDHVLTGNVSEFRELFLYALFLVYARDLQLRSRDRQVPARP